MSSITVLFFKKKCIGHDTNCYALDIDSISYYISFRTALKLGIFVRPYEMSAKLDRKNDPFC
jgi:hypothetical protein